MKNLLKSFLQQFFNLFWGQYLSQRTFVPEFCMKSSIGKQVKGLQSVFHAALSCHLGFLSCLLRQPEKGFDDAMSYVCMYPGPISYVHSTKEAGVEHPGGSSV